MITPDEARASTPVDAAVADAAEARLSAAVRGLPRGRVATVEVTDLHLSPAAIAEVVRRAEEAGWTAAWRSSRMGEEVYFDVRETTS